VFAGIVSECELFERPRVGNNLMKVSGYDERRAVWTSVNGASVFMPVVLGFSPSQLLSLSYVDRHSRSLSHMHAILLIFYASLALVSLLTDPSFSQWLQILQNEIL
jgi:hypothetical protein